MSSTIRRPSIVTAASITLVVVGLVLGVTVGMQFFVLFAAGAFGPSVLRELGLLRDLDEHQRAVNLRAGSRAYLVGGLLLCTIIVVRQWGLANLDHDQVPASAILACLLVTYYLSDRIEFWGATRAARIILLSFGALWLGFVVISHVGDAWRGDPTSLLAELALVVPFFGLAWAAPRWPRISGVALLLVGIGAFVLFQGWRALTTHPSALLVALTFPLPLLASGLALLLQPQEQD